MQKIGHAEAAGSGASRQMCSPIVELRQYTHHPGQREVLIELFEREFIESQEALGMQVIGLFRDEDDADRFIWLRGFADMPSRAAALQAFYYDGPVWQAHRKAANATISDASNVLLLRPARPTSGFALDPDDRPPPGATQPLPGLIEVTIAALAAPESTDFLDFFEQTLAPVLTESGASILAYLVTAEHPNTFPALPVREGEHVFVWFSLFRDRAAYDEYGAALAGSEAWRDVSGALRQRITGAPQILRLSPTERSPVHG